MRTLTDDINTDVFQTILVIRNSMLVGSTKIGLIKIFDINNGQLIRSINEGNSTQIYAITLVNDDFLASCTDKCIKIWNINDGSLVHRLQSHSENVYCLSGFNGLLASGGEDKSIKIWNVSNGTLIKNLIGHARHLVCLAYLKEGSLVSVSHDRAIKIWHDI